MKNKMLFSFFSKNKYSYLAGLFFMFLASYIQTLSPRILGSTIDILKAPLFNYHIIYTKIALLLLISIATFVFTYIWRNLVIGNARKLECSLREDLYEHFQSLSQSFYSKRKTGDLIAYGINDVQAIRMAFGPATAMTINGIIICTSSIFIMLTSINSTLTLVTLIPIPFVVFIMLIIGKKIKHRFRSVQSLFGRLSDKVQQNINGLKVIKAYVQEAHEIESFELLNEEMMTANIKMVNTSSLLAPIIEACFSISFVLSLSLGGNMVLAGKISLGDFVAFNTYLAMIMAPIISIGRVINIFQRGLASLQRLQEIFSIPPEISEVQDAISEKIEGSIEFKSLTFFYPGTTKAAIKDITFKIKKGQTIGLIGKSGSGKTTLANLLLKLYNVEPGQIFLDNRDINAYSLESIRNSTSFVPQDTFLFSTSIKENIISFQDIYTEDEIETATKYSNIYESITSFPDSFDTILGERGVNLSGGQKQRISIARALIRHPSILILDDALSAVDTVTERHILKNFKTLRHKKTTLIISHRVSAVSSSDEIVVLHDGQIYEHGTHEGLIKKKGLYYEIFTEQNKEKEQHNQHT